MSASKTSRTIARRIFREEGLLPLLWRGFQFLARRSIQCGHFYIYEHPLEKWNEEDFRPRVANLTVRILHSNRDADELPPGLEDPRPFFLTARRRLDLGAPAFCLYIGGEFAHAGWIALTPEAKTLVDRVPFRVDFEHGEACTGGTWTRPKFRGLGLMTYSYFLRLDYLWRHGYARARNAVAVGNIASQKAHAKFGPRICAKGRYVRVGRWESWREQPLTTRS